MKSENAKNVSSPIRSVYECENADKIPVLFMFEGLSGCGKSYLAETLVTGRNGEYKKPITHSSDALREELFGDVNDQSHNGELFKELHKRIKDDLRNGNDVIYDATNINKKRRKAFLSELTHIDCRKVCICVLTPYEVCLQQNRNRERKVPDEVIKRMYLNWCPPSLDEGFDDIALTYNYGNIDRSRYTLKNFFEGEVNANASYDSFFYLDILGISQIERLHIADLIYYHVMPFTSRRQNKSAERRVRIQVGKNLYNEIVQLHEADLAENSCIEPNMVKMTPQEALKIITNAVQANNMSVRQDYALYAAQKALEKQIVKKPIHASEDIMFSKCYVCPACGKTFSGTGIADYCYHCGQALDWSEVI